MRDVTSPSREGVWIVEEGGKKEVVGEGVKDSDACERLERTEEKR